MEIIFIRILNMSISAGWVILAILLLRILLKKAPKTLRCFLWALAAIRLACPISLESALSLIPSAEPISKNILYDTTPTIESGIGEVNQVINPILSSSLSPNSGASANPLQIILYIASLIWIAGLLMMLIYLLLSCFRLRRRVAVSIQLENDLWLCDNVQSPFIFGILSPRIYLPSDLEKAQLSYIIAHEKAHLKRHDHWWKPLGFLLLSVYWFNPLCWAAYILLCRDIELACDEHVIKSMQAEEKKNYAEILLSCGTHRRMISACPLAFGEISVRERIQTVLNYRKPSFWLAAAGVILCAATAVCFLTNPVSAAKDIFSTRYRVAEILYDSPLYDFTYTIDNAPEYVFTADFDLIERSQEESPLGNNTWTVLGNFGVASYSQSQLYSLFAQTDGSAAFPLSEAARKRLDRVEKTWRADTLDANDRFYLAMETSDGEVLLAVGYGRAENSHIRWLWKMEGSSPQYSQEYLAGQISSMCGSDVNIFAIYESDTIPGKLLAGFHTNQNNKRGVAVFNCDDTGNSYSCTLKGYKTFPKDSLNTFTMGEDWGFDHSITIVLSSISNISRLMVQSGSIFKEAVPGSVTPAMYVFEWPELLSQEKADNIELLYETAYTETNDTSASDTPDAASDVSASGDLDSLDITVSSAILEYCATALPEESMADVSQLFLCESHSLLDTSHIQAYTSSDLPSLTGTSGQSEEITVYIMAMYQAYTLSPEGIQEKLSRYFPAKLTFIPSGDEDDMPGQPPITWGDSYILKEFWAPDGTYTGTGRETYEAQLRDAFPANIAEKSIKALTSQIDITAYKQACYAQAVEYGKIDTDTVIENLFETIMSSGSGIDSNPYAYLSACPTEHFILHYYGRYTLNYINSEFQKGDQTDLKGALMKIILEELT